MTFVLKRLHGLALVFDGLCYIVAGRSTARGVAAGRLIARQRFLERETR